MFSSIADSRFKTNLLTVNLVLPLARETVTENALIPLVLEKCWEEAPTNRALSRQLNRLYGASVGCGTVKVGSAAALTLAFSAIDSAYALEGENMLSEGAKILLGLLLRPVRKDGLLEEENLALQKQYLADTILADINEKRSYALGQTIRRMFEGEPCGLPRYGFLEDIEKITPETATAAWKRILDTARIEVFHVGMGDPSGAKALFAEAFAGMERHPLPLPPFSIHNPPASPKEFVEEKPVAQSKLCMGFAAGLDPHRPELPAMRLMAALLGGTPTSIEDRRRGVFSYEALRSRLTQGRFAREDMRDMLAPIIRLHPLSHEELLVLIEKLAQIHAGYFGYEDTVRDEDLVAFLQIEFGRVGAETHLTPREVIRDFIELLDIAYQNPDRSLSDLLRDEGAIADVSATAPAGADTGDAAPFAEFTI